MDSVMITWLVIMAVSLCLCIPWLIGLIREGWAEWKKELIYDKAHRGAVHERYYLNCKKAGIHNLSRNSKADFERIRQKLGYSGTDEELLDNFIKGKKEHAQACQRERELKERADRRRKEKAERAALYEQGLREDQFARETTKYASFTGVEKTIAVYDTFLQDALGKLKEAVDARSGSLNLMNQPLEKEKSWAIAGGIADGIAGPAAGVVTALSVQQKNAEIRQRNAQYLSNAAAAQAFIKPSLDKKVADATQLVSYYQEKITIAKEKLLIDNPPEEYLLSLLNLKIISKQRTSTGAVKLTIQAQCPAYLTIFDKVPAVVDGSAKAVFMSGDERLGEALFSLPVEKVLENKTIHAICLTPIPIDKSYTIKFEPHHLWVREYADL